uniref:Uncharacterized protein n=1 Tax=Setaria viridis TaxID=4556 RepID=A0A4U6VKK3_SETVI|nr:hypothetical protein SEVIR_2G019950v2 [Setaria viridis]
MIRLISPRPPPTDDAPEAGKDAPAAASKVKRATKKPRFSQIVGQDDAGVVDAAALAAARARREAKKSKAAAGLKGMTTVTGVTEARAEIEDLKGKGPEVPREQGVGSRAGVPFSRAEKKTEKQRLLEELTEARRKVDDIARSIKDPLSEAAK